MSKNSITTKIYANRAAFRRGEAISVVAIGLIIVLFVLPLPGYILDILISSNLVFALTLLLLTIFQRKVTDFLTFPAVLLLSTVLRLAITISTTRAVLSKGDAGHIISGFGKHAIGGNLVVGLIVFAIISIVLFLVVTKGAERVAEVAARFTLDAIPGKQMSIESDLRSGIITKEIARLKRINLEKESQFFGAMDAAMRFVKGDAIASMIVVIVNLIGGFTIGVTQKGMSFAEAGSHYAVLSIGDGLVAQIPALLSAVASGLMVTRIIGEEQSTFVSDVGLQFGREPVLVLAASGIVALLAFAPGFPTILMLIVAFVISVPSIFKLHNTIAKPVTQDQDARKTSNVAFTESADHEGSSTTALPKAGYNDPYVVQCSDALFDLLSRADLAAKIDGETSKLARQFGLAMPVVSFEIVETVPDWALEFLVEGVAVATVDIQKDFADPESSNPVVEESILGTKAASWISQKAFEHFSRLFNVDDSIQWLDSIRSRYGRVITDLENAMAPKDIASVVRGLLQERVSLRHARSALEAMVIEGRRNSAISDIIEACRLALSQQIQNDLAGKFGKIRVVTFGPETEKAISLVSKDAQTIQDFDRNEAARIALKDTIRNKVQHLPDAEQLVILTAPNIRSFVAILLAEAKLKNHVCSTPELRGYPFLEIASTLDLDFTLYAEVRD